MFNLDFLNQLREEEINLIIKEIPSNAKVLEIGGGTGQQAKLIADKGYEVVSIDLKDSTYSADRVYEIIEYDGRTLPFEDNSFDVIFSSNVLEHISDLAVIHKECSRVCKKEGFILHVMPTHVWRILTSATHYPDAVVRIINNFYTSWGNSFWPHRLLIAFFLNLARACFTIIRSGLPVRHGERGNVITEIYYFHPSWWRKHFEENELKIIEDKPMGLLYSGNMLLGKFLSFSMRAKLAKLLGSSCHMFFLKT